MAVNKPKTAAGMAMLHRYYSQTGYRIITRSRNLVLTIIRRGVFLFGSLNAQRQSMQYDPELLYISAVFHDSANANLQQRR